MSAAKASAAVKAAAKQGDVAAAPPAVEDAVRGLEQAETDAAAERTRLVSMETQIRAGATTVSAADLAEQERLTKFAELRAVGARQALKDAQHADTLRTAEAAVAKIAASGVGDPSALIDAWKRTVVAVRKLLELGDERAANIRAPLDEMSSLDEHLASSDMGSRSFGFQRGGHAGEHGFRIHAAGITVTSVPAAQLLAAAVEASLGDNNESNAVRDALAAMAPSDQTALRPIAERLPELLAAVDQVQHPDVQPAKWRVALTGQMHG